MINLKEISLYIIIATAITIFVNLIDSSLLFKYLCSNMITIQITLMAISAAIRGLIVSKLQDIKTKFPETSIKPITKSLLFSFKEQISLIILSVILLSIADSNITQKISYTLYFNFGIEILIYAIFIYAIDILWDTGNAIFVIVDLLDDLK